MAPPSLIDFVLSKRLADGIVVAGCAESACFNRLGVAWTEQRFAGARDPYLRARVPRDRLKTIWASALETGRFAREFTEFSEHIAAIRTTRLVPPAPQSIVPLSSAAPGRETEDVAP
jgi:coenzyme F420-reducing hydrogenase delta subunit